MTGIGVRSPRLWAFVTLVVVNVIVFQPFFIEAIGIDVDTSTRQYDDLPYRQVPGLQRLCEVAEQTIPEGEAAAFWVPYPKWWEGYSYSFMRASYLLASFRLIPLLDERDQTHPEVFSRVNWVVAVGGAPQIEGFEVAKETADGVLLRKAR